MLITADLHLSDRERDEYRWDLFPWIVERMEQLGASTLLILGDLTDEKDGHSARLVNRIMDSLLTIPGHVYILKGNHDYTDEDCPFFRFLGHEEYGARISFITKTTFLSENLPPGTRGTVMMLPHTLKPKTVWGHVKRLKKVRLACCHQPVVGAVTESGITMREGISSRYWSTRGYKFPVVAGDIHVPQTVGDFTYTGAPYPIKFGDEFIPRVLRFDGKSLHEIVREKVIRKLSVDIDDAENLAELELREGDQIKVRVHLPRSEFGVWEQHRARLIEIATDAGAVIHSAEIQEESRRKKKATSTAPKGSRCSDPSELLTAFCEERGIDPALENVAGDLIAGHYS